jgi:hypothetical protein
MMCKYLFERAARRLCLLNRYDSPTDEDCAACKSEGRDRVVGLGDRVATAINKTPIRLIKPKDCGCKQRQERLNELMPAKDSD